VSVQQSASQKSHLCFKVSDSGIGIDKTRLVSVFSAFTQASTDVTRNYGGTGLGLTIVKRLSEIMGGTVTVESELGKGSVFTTCINYLPVVQTLQANDLHTLAGLPQQAPLATETLQPERSQPGHLQPGHLQPGQLQPTLSRNEHEQSPQTQAEQTEAGQVTQPFPGLCQ